MGQIEKLLEDKKLADEFAAKAKKFRDEHKIILNTLMKEVRIIKRKIYNHNKDWVSYRKKSAKLDSKRKTLLSSVRSRSKDNIGKVINNILGEN